MYWGGVAGYGTGEGPSAGNVPRHTVTIHNPQANQTVTVEVPEDRCVRVLGVGWASWRGQEGGEHGGADMGNVLGSSQRRLGMSSVPGGQECVC